MTKCWSRSGSRLFDTLKVFVEKVILKKSADSETSTIALQMTQREHSGYVVECLTGGRGVEGRVSRYHCVVSLSKIHVSLLGTGATQEDPSRHNLKIVDGDVKNQIKQKKQQQNYKLPSMQREKEEACCLASYFF